jgi:hypothetical protein
MNRPFIKAQYYHHQAQKFRELADAEQDTTKRTALLQIAIGYETLSAEFLRMGQEAVKQKS